jgi:hypothetical protein
MIETSDDARLARDPLSCSRCGVAVAAGRGEYYLVDIRAVADPSPPVFTDDDLSQDAERAIAELLSRIRALTERQLLDEIYRRKLFCLCNACYASWIEDPVGAGTAPSDRTST